jgi:hypothetical protein
LRGFEALQGFLTANPIKPNPGSFFEETTSFICFEGKGGIDKSLTEDSVGTFC